MITLFVIATVAFFAYVITTVVKFGIPKSISDTYYIWLDNKNNSWLFTIFMFTITGLTFPVYMECANDNTWLELLSFLSCGGMGFLGCAAAMRFGMTKVVHFTGAGMWAAGMLTIALICGHFAIIGIAAVCSCFALVLNLIIGKSTNYLFWLECGVVGIMLSYFLIHLI